MFFIFCVFSKCDIGVIVSDMCNDTEKTQYCRGPKIGVKAYGYMCLKLYDLVL